MKAFKQIRRANQRDMRPGKGHLKITKGLLNRMKKGGARLRLSCLPSVTKHLRPPPNLAVDIGRINLTCSGEDSPLPLLFGLTARRRGAPPTLAPARPSAHACPQALSL